MRAKVVKILSAVGAAVVAIVVALLTQIGDETTSHTAATLSSGATSTVSGEPSSGNAAADSPVASRVAGVPERAYETLDEIDAGRWPDSANAPGTKGGITFQNREGRLPATDDSGTRVKYQEWDVNPKKPGQSRDAERIVTGSDGSAWYTGDHYDTFTRMR
ncbi:ribonuclease domain-containing protein [Nocardia flavorosea]|uniref:ribonuclease domain-containing protein n=1 Tax=Nocardia flavorosea TaxID=53429 RepID=UPI001FDFCE88|nr:ribonuclease domain-containing protein [Nocardia flavorosea]